MPLPHISPRLPSALYISIRTSALLEGREHDQTVAADTEAAVGEAPGQRRGIGRTHAVGDDVDIVVAAAVHLGEARASPSGGTSRRQIDDFLAAHEVLEALALANHVGLRAVDHDLRLRAGGCCSSTPSRSRTRRRSSRPAGRRRAVRASRARARRSRRSRIPALPRRRSRPGRLARRSTGSI